MRSTDIKRVFILLTALLIVILGSGAAFAQGKGKGGGEKHGGGGQAQHQAQQAQHQAQQAQHQAQHQAQQAQHQAQQAQKEQFKFQREAQKLAQQQQRQAWHIEQKRQTEIRQAPDNRGFQQWQNRVAHEQMKVQERQQKMDAKQAREYQKEYLKQAREYQKQAPAWSNAWPNNYGYYRSAQARALKAEHQAWKEEEKALRSSLRNDRVYVYNYQAAPAYSYQAPVYDNYSYITQYPQHARASILRNVIASVLGLNSGYNTYGNAQPYYTTPYYTTSYSPVNYGVGYDGGYPQYQYQSFAFAPAYYSYQPNGYFYDTAYEADPYDANNSYSDGILMSNYDSSSVSGGSFVQQLFTRLLALGYEQGYSQGLTARQAGYGDRYYYDPYDYNDTTYFSSISLGDNRRCLSDGYELGYRDALYDRSGAFPVQYVGPYANSNVDLVSVLIGSPLTVFSS